MDKHANDMNIGAWCSEALAFESVIDTTLTHAKELQDRIDQLRAEQHRILAPIVKRAIEVDDPNNTMALIKKLPPGLFRTQLRRHHVKRVENSEYTRRPPA